MLSPGAKADLLRSPLAAMQAEVPDAPPAVATGTGTPDAPKVGGAEGPDVATGVAAATAGALGESGKATVQASVPT